MTDTYFFDWAVGKINVLKNDDSINDQKIFRSLDQFLDNIPEPSTIIGECSFESFDLGKRAAFIDRCGLEGHTLLTTPTRNTGKRRDKLSAEIRSLGWNPTKSDEVDVYVIRDVAINGTHLKIPEIHDEYFVELHQAFNHELVLLRNTHSFRPRKGGKGPEVLVKDKDKLYDQLVPHLPKYRGLPDRLRLSLGNGTKYAESTVVPVAVASKYVNNQEGMQRYLGLFNHGYPCMARSELIHNSWKHRVKKSPHLTIGDFQYSVRWLFQRMLEIDDDLKSIQ